MTFISSFPSRKRNSTLLAMSLTSRLGYQSFYASLLRNVCLKLSQLHCFSQVLNRKREAGKLIKYLTLFKSSLESENRYPLFRVQLDHMVSSKYENYQAVPQSHRKHYQEKAKYEIMGSLLSQIKYLQTLVILSPDTWKFPLVDGKQVPLSF